MGKWTKERVVEELKIILGDRLEGVVLYGSQAAGDSVAPHSDVNLLIVTKTLTTDELQTLSKVVVPWVKAGNHPPLFLTRPHLKAFARVFPVEILDIEHNHQVLYGSDPFEGFSVSHDHLRTQLQHELQAKLIRLKTHFILAQSNPKLVQRLMIHSLSSFLVLFKNALWLYQVKPEAQKMKALQQLKNQVSFDLEPFLTVDSLKRGAQKGKLDILQVFRGYLSAIETIVDQIDKLG